MNRLSELTVNKNNNFNLIRLAAALAVLINHSFPLATGREVDFWIGSHLGISLGSIAVDIFFATSGFLVTGSLLSNNNILRFIKARILRIYPALIVMLLITTILIGGYFTSLHMREYLASSDTLRYLLKNGSLFTGASYTLPGVFETNPYKESVNGSLWTLPYEIWMYSTLAFAWIISSVSQGRSRIFRTTIVTLALFALVTYNSTNSDDTKLFSMFFSGAAFCVLQKRITLSLPLFLLAAMALMASMLDKEIFHVVYSLTLTYLLMCAAYMPSGRIRAFNRIGDYSYGVYIYAFPVQQSVAAFFPGISVAGMFQISLLITFMLAVLSWHFIEKPALALKGVPSARYSSRLT